MLRSKKYSCPHTCLVGGLVALANPLYMEMKARSHCTATEVGKVLSQVKKGHGVVWGLNPHAVELQFFLKEIALTFLTEIKIDEIKQYSHALLHPNHPGALYIWLVRIRIARSDDFPSHSCDVVGSTRRVRWGKWLPSCNGYTRMVIFINSGWMWESKEIGHINRPCAPTYSSCVSHWAGKRKCA